MEWSKCHHGCGGERLPHQIIDVTTRPFRGGLCTATQLPRKKEKQRPQARPTMPNALKATTLVFRSRTGLFKDRFVQGLV